MPGSQQKKREMRQATSKEVVEKHKLLDNRDPQISSVRTLAQDASDSAALAGGVLIGALTWSNSTPRQFTHGHPGNIPYNFVAQYTQNSVDWYNVYDGVGGWSLSADTTRVWVTNTSGVSSTVRVIVWF